MAEKEKKKSKASGCGLLLLLGIVAIIALRSCGGEEVSEAEAGRKTVAVPVEDLWRAYNANEVAAQQTYGGVNLLVDGTIERVTLDITDKPVVVLRTPGGEASVNFLDGQQAAVGGLNKGERVSFNCPEVRELMGMPVLRRCTVGQVIAKPGA